MYEFLDGEIHHRAPTRLALRVGGVAYDIAVPLGADFRPVDAAAAEEGASVRVWTHLVVREDAHMLFGFPDARLRELFRLLLKVRGVGPGLAQGILSSLSETELLEAIAGGDPLPLTRIKGVGKKTAEQILLDLRDRAPRPGEGDPGVIPTRHGADQARVVSDAVAALVSIGYTDKQARTSVERASRKISPDRVESAEDLERLVRAALRE